ncbi:Ulp1-like peptidase [Cucumis melo var. makuwa]|uniref:Ulp1-like peptidase n=1 Tax=Cucumis melo var. makuwa TaxID=1194695 RepID=A0A5A7THV0_CUCMM|nr:Ulp1-like peptidase [Cucumis melo var. makuwa]
MLVENEIVLCLDSLGPYMNESEFKKDYPTLQFENDKDGGKMLVFYFIKLAMMSRKRRQHIDWTMLGMINDLKDFISYAWSELVLTKTFSSLKGALHGKWPCTRRNLQITIPQNHVAFTNFPSPFSLSLRDSIVHQWVRIYDIEPMDDERAYLDRSLEIPMFEGYEEGLHDPSPPPHVQHPLPYIQHPHS